MKKKTLIISFALLTLIYIFLLTGINGIEGTLFCLPILGIDMALMYLIYYIYNRIKNKWMRLLYLIIPFPVLFLTYVIGAIVLSNMNMGWEGLGIVLLFMIPLTLFTAGQTVLIVSIVIEKVWSVILAKRDKG